MKSKFGWLLGLVAGVVLLVLLTPENQQQVLAQSVKTNGVFGGLLLGGTTNIISDNGTTLTRNGSAISGGGGIVGTVSNSVAQSGLLAVDATKTNGVAATFGHVTNALGYLPATNSALGNYVLKAGDTMSGTLGFSGTSTLVNLPSLTTAQKTGATPQAGSLVYDSDLGRVQAYDGAAWHSRVRLDGDTMTGPLVITNSASANVPFTINGLSGQTNNLLNVTSGGTNLLNVNKTGDLSVAGFGFRLNDQPSIIGYAIRLLTGGSSQNTVLVTGNGLLMNQPGAYVAWANNGDSPDLALYRDGAANTLAQRNGANAQTFRVYNTYSDASNFERLNIAATSTACDILASSLGTGVLRPLRLGVNNTAIWQVATNGHLLAVADNTYDIGANGATRPRHAYIGSNLRVGGIIYMDGFQIQSNGRSGIYTPGDGDLILWNAAQTDFGVLYFGGNTSSNFPTLIRSGSQLKTTKSDGSPTFFGAAGLNNGFTKVLTSTTAADFLYIAVPNTNMIGGKVLYTVSATDGTDSQQITGTCQFGAVGKGTAVTANITDTQNTSTVSDGTLSAVLAKNVTTNNVFALGLTATTSLTTTNLTIKWRLETPSTYTVNPL